LVRSPVVAQRFSGISGSSVRSSGSIYLFLVMPTSSSNVDLLMSDSATAAEGSRLQAYFELTKMRISVMVLITYAVAGILAAVTTGVSLSGSLLLAGMLGMLLVAASGNAANMYLERFTDYLMPRTASRPLPSMRLSAGEVALFTAVTLGAGTAVLWQLVNWQTAVCGLANWILYALIYTPLKRYHWMNTEVGAVAGAMPIAMGALTTTGGMGLVSWSFFGVLFFWQFPHFMAIAWKYREQYGKGGLKMLTVTEPTGWAAGRKAVVTAIALLGVSLLPVVCVPTRWQAIVLVLACLLLGGIYLAAAWRFWGERNDLTARQLMRVSLIYLPLYMLVLMLACYA
jgi:protoheme IX farnesyltransferase